VLDSSTINISRHALERYRSRIGPVTRATMRNQIRNSHLLGRKGARKVCATCSARLRDRWRERLYAYHPTGIIFILRAIRAGVFLVLTCWPHKFGQPPGKEATT